MGNLSDPPRYMGHPFTLNSPVRAYGRDVDITTDEIPPDKPEQVKERKQPVRKRPAKAAKPKWGQSK